MRAEPIEARQSLGLSREAVVLAGLDLRRLLSLGERGLGGWEWAEERSGDEPQSSY